MIPTMKYINPATSIMLGVANISIWEFPHAENVCTDVELEVGLWYMVCSACD